MKIDNIDSITNKEKSPDKAERAASIEDIKKSQSKFFDYTNDLAATTATATATSVANCVSNDLLEGAGYELGTSKLKKLLLNSDPEVANLNEYNNNSNNNVIKNEVTQEVTSKKSKQPKNALPPPPQPTPSTSSKNKQKLFLCSECNDYFLKLNLFNHMKTVHNKLTCLYCYGFFEKIEKLQQHLARKHKVQTTTIYDEQSLKSCFNVNGKVKEVSPDGSAASGSSKVINAVCCKCATIFNTSENNFHTHTCGGGNNEKKSMALNSKQNNSLAVQQQQQHEVIANHLQINSVVAASASVAVTAKDDVYCEQAIQQWLQPTSNNDNNSNNSRTTFNGGKDSL